MRLDTAEIAALAARFQPRRARFRSDQVVEDFDLHVRTRAEMAKAAAVIEQSGYAHHLPLIRAAMRSELAALFVPPAARIRSRVFDPIKTRRPHVIVFSGDGDPASGPDGFPDAARALRWAAFVMLHGSGATPFHYEIAAEAARQVGRAVLVETNSALLPVWIDMKNRLAPTTPGMIIQVPAGKPAHPAQGAPAGAVVH